MRAKMLLWIAGFLLGSSQVWAAGEAFCGPSAAKLTNNRANQGHLAGETIHEARRTRHRLGKEASQDLKIEEELAKTLSQHAITAQGKRQLRWQLENPEIDIGKTRARQQAVQELVTDDRLRETIRKQLTKSLGKKHFFFRLMERLIKGKEEPKDLTEEFDKTLEKFHAGLPLTARVLRGLATQVTPMLLALKLGLQSMGGTPQQIGAASYMHLMFSVMNGMTQADHRANLMAPKYQMIAASRLAPQLSKAQSPLMRDLGYLFSAVDSFSHPLGLWSIGQQLKWSFKQGGIVGFADSFGVTSWGLAYTNWALQNELSKVLTISSGLSDLETLLALADLKRAHPNLIFPTFVESETPELSVRNMHHPVHYLAGDSVPNSLDLGGDGDGIVFLTGPNGRGKSTVMKALALNVLLAQNGGPVFAESMTLSPLRLLVNMRSADSNTNKESLYMVESRRLGEIATMARSYPNTLVLIDEMSTGTTSGEALATEHALLEALAATGAIGMVATHKRELSGLESEIPGVVNMHVSDSDDIARKYRLEDGPSARTNAFEVQGVQGMPTDIVERAKMLYDQRYSPAAHTPAAAPTSQLLPSSIPSNVEPLVTPTPVPHSKPALLR